MVKCPRCGYVNSSSAVYCDNCAYFLANANKENVQKQKRGSGWMVGIAKKIVIVLGIIVIGFLLFSFIYNNSQPTPQESLNIVTDDGSHHQTSSYPYSVQIRYNGSWYAEMGDPNYLQTKIDYGIKAYSLECAAWEHIYINVQKQDYGEGELKVQLLKSGKVVAENSTTEPNAGVVINYNS